MASRECLYSMVIYLFTIYYLFIHSFIYSIQALRNSDLIPSKGTQKNEDLAQSTYYAHFCLKQRSKTMRKSRKHCQNSKQAPVEKNIRRFGNKQTRSVVSDVFNQQRLLTCSNKSEQNSSNNFSSLLTMLGSTFRVTLGCHGGSP